MIEKFVNLQMKSEEYFEPLYCHRYLQLLLKIKYLKKYISIVNLNIVNQLSKWDSLFIILIGKLFFQKTIYLVYFIHF